MGMPGGAVGLGGGAERGDTPSCQGKAGVCPLLSTLNSHLSRLTSHLSPLSQLTHSSHHSVIRLHIYVLGALVRQPDGNRLHFCRHVCTP